MIRYFLWQFKHMHTLHFDTNEQGEVYCPVCQSIYKQKGRKPLSAPFTAAWLTMRRILQDEQERLNSLSNQQLNTTTVNTNTFSKATLPPAPKQEVSRYAQWSFYLIFFALGALSVALGLLATGIAVGVVSSLAITGFALLASISLGILSLRENL